MKGLTPALLGQACRTFLQRAYPAGEHTIPPAKRALLAPDPTGPLEPLLAPPLCQPVMAPGGGLRGYAFRLGSAVYPHLKLQVVACDDIPCVFSVDTHDALLVAPDDPDAARWNSLRAANRRLKEEIESAWEAEGLWTFNGLLRRELKQA